MGSLSCVLHVHAQPFISPVACLLCSCCVVLWFRAICIHGCVVCACCWCCCCLCFFFSLLLLFCLVFLSVCLLTRAPGGSPPGFPTRDVFCLVSCDMNHLICDNYTTRLFTLRCEFNPVSKPLVCVQTQFSLFLIIVLCENVLFTKYWYYNKVVDQVK